MGRWYERIEEQEGKPIREVLKEAYDEFGVGKQVAAHFGISRGTLSDTLVILGLRQKTIVVCESEFQQEEHQCAS